MEPMGVGEIDQGVCEKEKGNWEELYNIQEMNRRWTYWKTKIEKSEMLVDN